VKKLFLFPLLILLVIGFILTGCGTPATTTTATEPITSAPTTAAPTTNAPTTAVPTTATPTTAVPTAPTSQKTLTIGLMTDLTSVMGVQVMGWQTLLTDMVNARGGLKIGNETYLLKTITYSTDNDFNKGVAGVNRLIFQDKVKFIISHGIVSADFICPVAEPEKVLTFCLSTIWNSGFLDKWHYNFAMLGQGTGELAVAGYMIDTYPEIKEPAGGGKGLALAFPDNASGHQSASNLAFPYKCLGAQPSIVYYPADQRDLSSLGTKIATLNPWGLIPGMGKVEDMALASAAAYDGGYRGHFFHFLTSDIGLLAPIYKPEVLEGYICSMTAMEYGDYNGCMTQLASDMKNAYIAKFGKWDYADYMTTTMFFALIKALENAGSIDVEKVAAELHKPLTFDYPDGPGVMIVRPDMRLDGSCVDANTVRSMKIVKNKQPTLLTTFTLDQIMGYVQKAYPPLPPGATPTIAPPA
jgi:ABC-type branched-subunit amino acid transport system substrate-binding protein